MRKPLHGVLVIDKPAGPTSHDVVANLRRTLRTRAIGHAGTLDPAATGVLVVVVGEATKLSPFLTEQNKSYVATVSFGKGTTTLDAEGEVTEERSLSPELLEELANVARGERPSGILARALAEELRRREQVPPAFSAIKQRGRPVHERARRGEVVELAPRPVEVASIEVVGATESTLTVRIEVSKGYYVRSFARDLGASLDAPAHLTYLRRTQSGPFSVDEAIDPSSSDEALRAALVPLADAACRVMPCARLNTAGEKRARQGKRLRREDFITCPPEGAALSAWLAEDGALVAIGVERSEGEYAVQRGFVELPA